jgi:hypothetical protein
MYSIRFITQNVKDYISKEEYESLCYDGSISYEEYIPDTKSSLWFILLKGQEPTGFIRLDAMSNVMWNCHIYIKEQYRGKYSLIWGLQVIQVMKETFKAKKLLAITPYKNAVRYAENLGFSALGTLKNSIQKGGKLLNQYMLEKEL